MKRWLLFVVVASLLFGEPHIAIAQWDGDVARQSVTTDPPAQPGTEPPYDPHNTSSIPWEAAPPGFPMFRASLWVVAIALAIFAGLGVMAVLEMRRTRRRRDEGSDEDTKRVA